MKRLLFAMMCLFGLFTLNAQTEVSETLVPVKWTSAVANDTSVVVNWSMDFLASEFEDFETGTFVARNWKNDGVFPWVITEDAYQSGYAMKSSCEKVNDTTSAIELEVNVPYDGFMSFNHRVSSEDNADYGNFYIDGVLQTTISGNREWRYAEVYVTEGTHVYKWEYTKDGSRHTYDDAYFVDNITFFKETEIKGGWIGYADDKWATSIGSGSETPVPTYWGISFPVTKQYAGQTLTKISVFDAAKGGSAQYTANIYLGGDTIPQTLVSTKKFALTGSDKNVEVELSTPVAIDGTQPLWITLFCEKSPYPASASLRSEYLTTDWLSEDGKNWKHAYEYKFNLSWMIEGYLEDASGNERSISLSNEENGFTSEYNVYKRDLYKKTTELVAENTTATEYIDNTWKTMGPGAYKWGVAALYDTLVEKSISTESFEDGKVPTDWAVYADTIKLSGLSHNWKMVKKYSEISPKDGEYYAVCPTQASYNEYLVTSKMRIPEASSLQFSYVNPKNGENYSRLFLYVSTSPKGGWKELWSTRPGKFVSRWTDVSVDLSEYAGQDVYFAFFNKYNGSWVAVDNVSLWGLSGEADVVWSNTISKDMSTDLTVTVETDSNDPVAGTVISLVNKVENEYAYSTILGLDDSYTFKGIRKGVYEVNISKKGFVSEYEGETIELWEPKEIECLLSENLAPVENLYVSPTGWVMWDGEHIGVGDEFYFDFEDMTLNGWTTMDVDNDNYTWQNSIEIMAPGSGHNYSVACATSMSWIFGVVLTPDNYLVTENKYKIDETSKLRFWVCAQDMSAPNEHYGVAVSLASNDKPEDFITIWEETLTLEQGTTREQSQWYEKVVDLSDYAGQEIYIALRHFNCTDQFYLNVDDISLESTARNNRALASYQVYLDGKLVAEDLKRPYYQHEDLVDGQKYTTTVIPVYGSEEGVESSYTWRKMACDKLEGISDLTAEYSNGVTTINWTLPENKAKNGTRGGEWLTYDNGEWEESVTLLDEQDNPISFHWGVMFPKEDLVKYTDQYLTKVSMYDKEAYEGMLYIYKGGLYSPQVLLHEQPYQCTGSDSYVEVELETAIAITGKDNIWVVLHNTTTCMKPATGSVDCGDANSRWIAFEDTWVDLSMVSTARLSWQIRAFVTDEEPALPEADMLGVNIFRNGSLISNLVQDESFVDDEAQAGDEYELRVVYGGAKDITYYAMSCPETVVADLACPAPRDLYAYSTLYKDGRYGTVLKYPYIPPTSEWLYYDLGSMVESVGGVETFYYGIKFPVEKLEDYAGTSMTKIMFYDYVYEGGANEATFYIYYGGDKAPEMLVHAQTYMGSGIGDFAEVELISPLPVSGEENIWIIVKTNNGMNWPAALSKDCGDSNARWISMDGEKWQDVTDFGFDGSFMIRAFVTNEGRGIAMNSSTRDLSLVNYNIYRGTTLDNIELVATTKDKVYFDEVEKGTYYYQVTAVYEENGQECVSAPARAYGNYAQNYVMVEVTAVEENGVNGLNVYPNPTKGNLNINAEAMRRITITNTLGQVVYDQEVDSDNEVVDMTQYQTGIYMVRIATDNGVAVKRINVVR